MQFSWQPVPGAASYIASVSPFAYTYDWLTPYATLPDPAQWILDNRRDTNSSGFSFDTSAGPRVAIRLNGASQCDGSGSSAPVRCPMLYRRVPPSPIVTVDIDMAAAASALSAATSVTAGIVVFSARSSSPLMTCGLQVLRLLLVLRGGGVGGGKSLLDLAVPSSRASYSALLMCGSSRTSPPPSPFVVDWRRLDLQLRHPCAGRVDLRLPLHLL
jgi:hypothetical protein